MKHIYSSLNTEIGILIARLMSLPYWISNNLIYRDVNIKV
ncbi:hypothetical protein Runsl_1597 [Runella slithyformis DSM 19594]|uniref:Uncharacterized protein n=1 Tax=Runella slithyformis (strain ATCC 29530 / DSM 19594 / LMG 11500 / NCIMB 11436 / LSU 4) TaxID=761193 RepID=A0A7U3ZIY9_RUNSL|nr:hypothetical protein Runsl_1597 [Runella slithyformis DSM 19594]